MQWGGCATVKHAAAVSAIDPVFAAGRTEIVELMGRRSGIGAEGISRQQALWQWNTTRSR